MITVVGLDGGPPPPSLPGLLAAASLIVGGARHLAAVPVPPGARTVVMGNVPAALDAVADASGDVVVLASGDPGFFGIVRALRARGHEPRVLPAVSSVAQAFARAGLPWDDALIVSAHGSPTQGAPAYGASEQGRELRRVVNACRAHPKVAVLTAPGSGPAELARELFPQTPRTFVVCENLGEPDERVVHVRPAEASTRPWRDPNVVLVLDPRHAVGAKGWLAGGRPGPSVWALPEDAFAHRDSLVTKAEVRAFALAKLGPRIGDMVWDVGAGSGSVAIECARFGAAVIAIEKDEASCERIRANVRAHEVKVAVSRGTAPDVLRHLPDPDAVFVGGGGPDVVRACAERALRTVVVTLAALERVRPSMDALRAEGFTVEAVQLQANRLSPLPGDVHRLAATNPVHVVWGERNPTTVRPPEPPHRRPITDLPGGAL
ncbi:bifunctional cobalt-precorrin-7 (C(5))-methyltransferase/cobalt-precorrin-6B (C(15))-methyltransferase [Actinomadura oligospora]|uniref:bifunctional cobalt-precorrin-7 (C(5))-methyltransferase/cobalt-precorrin-6B (C(15))-methyltransferase n=1 Tax=Actinomadura oligospora TaxID=111804 RepID=UPI00047CF16B|nr:bifunctional cobalt-precorrin-7 (C(5))-methyltransferase/cobalt-precorrin-6B (C(15))-methyltransferase [Actinomadura oligospora]